MINRPGAAQLSRKLTSAAIAATIGLLVGVYPFYAWTARAGVAPHHDRHDASDRQPAAPKPNGARRHKQKEETVQISLAGGFSPQTLTIRTGTTVVWKSGEAGDYPVVDENHQVVAMDGSFASPQITWGSSWSHRFLKPGTFEYHCANHSHETATLVVEGPPIKEDQGPKEVRMVEPDPNDKDSYAFDPADVTVETGTTVIWRNTGAQDHTATDDDGAFDSGTVEPGGKWDFTFKKPGVYNYICEPHPWMKGVIRVADPGEAPPPEEEEEESGGSSSSQPPPPPSGGESGPQTHTVNMIEPSNTDEWGFNPPTLAVQVGDTVTWANTGATAHTATADDGSFDSGSVAAGASWDYTFEEVGEFPYHCEPHPWMKGTIVVSKEPPKEGAAGAVADPTLDADEGVAGTTEDAATGDDAQELEGEAAGALGESGDSRFWFVFGSVYIVAAAGAFAAGVMRGYIRGRLPQSQT